MSVLKAIGVVIVILLALWLIFALIGVVVKVISFVVIIGLVLAVGYGAFHLLTRNKS